MSNRIKTFSIILAVMSCLLLALLLFLWFWLVPRNSSPYIDLGCKYVYVDHDICRLDSTGCLILIIPDDVDDYMFDNHYVLAHQNPVFIRADYFWEYGLEYNKDSINNIKRLCNDLHDCYWIICKDNDSVLGPMSYKEYKQKCEILDVKIELGAWRQVP